MTICSYLCKFMGHQGAILLAKVKLQKNLEEYILHVTLQNITLHRRHKRVLLLARVIVQDTIAE